MLNQQSLSVHFLNTLDSLFPPLNPVGNSGETHPNNAGMVPVVNHGIMIGYTEPDRALIDPDLHGLTELTEAK